MTRRNVAGVVKIDFSLFGEVLDRAWGSFLQFLLAQVVSEVVDFFLIFYFLLVFLHHFHGWRASSLFSAYSAPSELQSCILVSQYLHISRVLVDNDCTLHGSSLGTWAGGYSSFAFVLWSSGECFVWAMLGSSMNLPWRWRVCMMIFNREALCFLAFGEDSYWLGFFFPFDAIVCEGEAWIRCIRKQQCSVSL